MKNANREMPAAELHVLGSLWRLGQGTVREVLQDLNGQGRRLAYTTVLTLLTRLESRGCVSCSRENTANVYRPRVSREQVTAHRLDHLVRQLGDGEAMPLILQLVEAHALSKDDIRQLRERLDELAASRPGS